MNHPAELRPSALTPDVQQLLEQSPTAETLAQVDAWLEHRATDAEFWRSLTAADTVRLEKWMLGSRRVQASWALSAVLCLAVTLFFSAHPMETFDKDPVSAVFFTLVLTGLVSLLVFSALFAPFTRCWNFAFKVRAASGLSRKLGSVYDGELDGFYKRVNHFPAACQYIFDVKRHRQVLRQDFIVAAALVPPEFLMTADHATR
jgi:hypothetical protein